MQREITWLYSNSLLYAAARMTEDKYSILIYRNDELKNNVSYGTTITLTSDNSAYIAYAVSITLLSLCVLILLLIISWVKRQELFEIYESLKIWYNRPRQKEVKESFKVIEVPVDVLHQVQTQKLNTDPEEVQSPLYDRLLQVNEIEEGAYNFAENSSISPYTFAANVQVHAVNDNTSLVGASGLMPNAVYVQNEYSMADISASNVNHGVAENEDVYGFPPNDTNDSSDSSEDLYGNVPC